MIAIISGLLANRRLAEGQRQIFRLLVIAEEVSKANGVELEALDREFKGIVGKCVGELAEGTAGTDQAAVSLAIEHARRSIEGKKAAMASTAHAGADASVIA